LRTKAQLSIQDRAELEKFRQNASNPDEVARLRQQLAELQKAQGPDGREPNQEALEEQNGEKEQVEVHEEARAANVMRLENRVEINDSEDSSPQIDRGFSANGDKSFWNKKLSKFTPDWLTRKRAAGVVGAGLLAWLIGTDKLQKEKEIQYKSNNIASGLSNTQMAVGATAALATAALYGKNFCADKKESRVSDGLFGGIITRIEESDDNELWVYFLGFIIFSLVLLLSLLLCSYYNPKPVVVPDLDPPDLEMANAERVCELEEIVQRKHSVDQLKSWSGWSSDEVDEPRKAGSRALQISRNLKQYKKQKLSGMQLMSEINSRKVSVLPNPRPNDGGDEIFHV